MGSFYGSIHARHAAVERALPVLRDVARKHGVSFYVRPTATWLSIYPSERGQDMAISARISATLQVPVVHVLLHDSDVIAYSVYSQSTKLDEFVSNPDYFGLTTGGDRERVHGQPARFAELISPASSVMEVEEILEAARRGSASSGSWLLPGEQLDDVVKTAEREVDEVVEKARPLKARLDEQLLARAREQLGIQESDLHALIIRLARHRDPAARHLLDDHERQLTELLRAAAPADGILRRMHPPRSMEELFREFARALDLPDAELTYEDLEEDALPAVLHVTTGRDS